MLVHTDPDARVDVRVRWSVGTRLAFRLGFSVAVLSVFHLLYFVRGYLYFERLRTAADRLLNPLGNGEFRVARYVGAATVKFVTGATGSVGEVANQHIYPLYYLVAVSIAATTITLVWTALDRGRTEYVTLNRWLRVYARYALALVMMTYAMVKVVPTQFGYLTPGELLKPVGQLNRFWVLWNFMVVSTGYTIFAGLTELLGSILLFFRRTTLLGALILFAALTNVFAMDIAYTVFGAAMVAGLLIVLAAIVVAPYTPALVNVLLLGRTDRIPTEPPVILSQWRYAPLAKVIVLVLFVSIHGAAGVATRRTYYGGGHAIYGMFEVERFVRSGVVVTPLANDAKTWKRVATDGRYDSAAVSVQFANGVVRQYRLKDDTAKQEWTLSEPAGTAGTLHYRVSADGAVSLDGRIGDDPVQLQLRPIELNTFLLLRNR